MKLEMTQRDKRLLVFLAVLVLVVCIGCWGIRPQLTAAADFRERLEEEQEKKRQNEMKLSQLTDITIYNEELRGLIQEEQEGYFSMMSSDEVDRYITELVLEYDLFIYELSIQIGEGPELESYVYSQKSLTGESQVLDRLHALELSDIPGTDQERTADATEEGSGIYSAAVSLRLFGHQEDIDRFLDGLAEEERQLRLCSFRADEQDEGMLLELSLEIYMCEK